MFLVFIYYDGSNLSSRHEVNKMEFKDRLKALRKEKKLTQSELGSMLNYGYTAISNYESGRNEPSIKDLKKIAAIFNVSMDYLLCVNDIRNPYVERDYPESFDNLKTTYSMLNDQNRTSAEDLVQWLYTKQLNESNSAVEFKVAQPTPVYKSKKNN